MKFLRFALIGATVLFVVGCERGEPTLIPTLAPFSTATALPTETPLLTDTPSGPTPIPTDTPIPMARVRRQATLRTGPGVDYAVAGMAQFAQDLVVYGKCEGWLLVSGDRSAWIIVGKVILDVDIDTIPDACDFHD